MLGSLIASRTASQENMIVECFRHLVVVSSRGLDFRCFRFLRRMAGGHAEQYQNLNSQEYAPHPVRRASFGTVQ